MKFLHYKNFLLAALLAALVPASCTKDLQTVPLDPTEYTANVVYSDPTAYRSVMAKLYAGLAVSGQQGPSGQPDIAGIDEGFSTYLRQYWKMQELTTDEAVIGWNDGTIKDLHWQVWTPQNEFITAMYNRIYFQISLCNEFLRESTPEKLSGRGQTNLEGEVSAYRAEARFLRALSYWHALDLFRNVPFVTEKDAVGAFFPPQISGNDLFAYIETELKDILPAMASPKANEYGRADRAAAWTLLAKLYLNGKVYTGQDYNAQCLECCQKVIDAGYDQEATYANLFKADNNTAKGIIFPVTFDGVHTKTWGGMTFIVHAGIGGSMKPADFGVGDGWGGTRTTKNLVGKFASGNSGTLIVSPNAGNSANYTKLYCPGNYQGWDPSKTSTVLTSKANDGTFEGYLYFKDAAGEFKFCVNPDWSVNFGDTGANGSLEAGGDNIKLADAGLYKVNVDMNAKTYTIQKTAWGLIGDATADGWNSDQDMTYDETDGSLTITADLTAGAVKFRANDDWSLNYGDTGKDAILEPGGDNIAIADAGRYRIRLYLAHPDYTYSVEKFSFDSRALFHSAGQSLEIGDIALFTEGYGVRKFSNLRRDGSPGSDNTFVDTDFPMFRIEDVYLMAVEAHLRGGGGEDDDILKYINRVRERAFGGPAGDIIHDDLTLELVLDERARELYWECSRRTDLIRFGLFTGGDYLWPWKGKTADGIATDAHFNIMPIPASDLGANPNLRQNPGY